MKNLWRLWAKALGEKAGKNDDESDKIALIRTIIFISYLTTNLFIIANAVRHWNSNQQNKTIKVIYVDEIRSSVHQTQKEGL
jgi:hypothetical protein